MELKISGCEFRENVGTLLRRDTPQLANVEDVVTLDPGKGGALLSTGARVSATICFLFFPLKTRLTWAINAHDLNVFSACCPSKVLCCKKGHCPVHKL